MAEVLALVDVDSESAPETWPLLLEAVRNAHFTALDLELSGLGDVIGRGKGHTIHTRYSDACEAVKTRAMLSLGVACYRWKQPLESRERVQNTNSQYANHTAEPFATTTRLMRESHTPTVTETALEGNDTAAVPLERSDTLEETTPERDDALVLEETAPGLEESAREINATLALGKEAGPGIAVLEDSAHGEKDVVSVGVEVKVFNVWLMCQRPYTIDPSSAHFLVQHGFDFNRQFARGIPYTPGPMEVQRDEKRVCLHHLLATILAVGKPLVVHNGWIDLLFLYGNLYSPLPPSLGTLMADFSEMFVGGVYDTKAIAQYQIPQEATFLEYLFRKWSATTI
ncbi:Target of EGR1 protein 1 [Geodia barretti]|uniref:Target of EGR1 protein 1 n=1 Tax=Geodia barretti TaxID=519541 RepID=A0AA35SFU4_GEOBA|nr:Target of EGR1 protein 1 [Geodia barretti]